MVNSVVHRKEMLAAAVDIAGELQFSGCLGLEFMLKGEAAYLMDFNPRINTGSVHPLSRYGLLPLDVLEALYLGLASPQDPRLGIFTPSDLNPHHNVFLKFDYRKFERVYKVAVQRQNKMEVPIPHSHFSHAPWCDEGLRDYLDREEHIVFDEAKCTVSFNLSNAHRHVAAAPNMAGQLAEMLRKQGIQAPSALGGGDKVDKVDDLKEKLVSRSVTNARVVSLVDPDCQWCKTHFASRAGDLAHLADRKYTLPVSINDATDGDDDNDEDGR
jgi:hypothetical protein